MENNHDLDANFEKDLFDFINKYIDVKNDLTRLHFMVFSGILGLSDFIEYVRLC